MSLAPLMKLQSIYNYGTYNNKGLSTQDELINLMLDLDKYFQKKCPSFGPNRNGLNRVKMCI
jgi:hypothetical protein